MYSCVIIGFRHVLLATVFVLCQLPSTIIIPRQGLCFRDLNRHGLHEDLFGHFVQNLLEACQPYQLSAEQDYRRLLVRYSYPLCLGV